MEYSFAFFCYCYLYSNDFCLVPDVDSYFTGWDLVACRYEQTSIVSSVKSVCLNPWLRNCLLDTHCVCICNRVFLFSMPSTFHCSMFRVILFLPSYAYPLAPQGKEGVPPVAWGWPFLCSHHNILDVIIKWFVLHHFVEIQPSASDFKSPFCL